MFSEKHFTNKYESSLGKILLAADEEGLIGLWFEGQKYFAKNLSIEHEEKNLKIFDDTKKWLDIYFSSCEPKFLPQLHMLGTEFQISVWKLLLKIPYGKTTTYGELAKIIAGQKNLPKMSAQAVGGAIAHNNISIIIPCHRVIGSNGSLTGYAGGIDKKSKLLELEQVNNCPNKKYLQV